MIDLIPPKRVLLIDAVVWSPLYPASTPLRNVHRWYTRWFEDLPGVTFQNVGTGPETLAAARAGVDGVIISGSPRDAWDEDPVNLRLCELARYCQEHGIPVLGVCYGHQILARALGGTVARHAEGLEVGNIPVQLTPAGLASPLFAGFPERFEVIASHADEVTVMPPGAALLARGAFSLRQSFEWKNQFYGVQFHPETDPEVMRFIWSARREVWRPKVTFDLDQTLDSMRPTPLAPLLLRNFVTRIIP
jgi:GMP synthase (glutamine-hydrolysing)